MAKKRETTAAEFMAELHADPDWVARRKAAEAELAARDAEWAKAEAPVVKALHQVGLNVESVWDLVNTAEPYPEALPLLLDHLQRDYPDRVREGIARALAVREAKFGWRILVDQFRRDPDTEAFGAKGGIGVALAAAADDTVMGEVIDLIRDRRHGGNRAFLIAALARSSRPEVHQVLLDLKDDDEIGYDVRKTLRLMRRKSLKNNR